MVAIIEFIQKSFGFYFGDNTSYDYVEKEITWQEAFYITIGFSFFVSLISIFIEYTYTTNPNFLVESLFSLILATAILLPIVIFLLSGLIFLCFKLFNGKNNFFETLKFWVSISLFSTLLLALIELIPTRNFSESANNIFDIIYAIYILTIFIWGFVVTLRIFQRLSGLSTVKSVIALILPIIIMIIIGILLFLLLLIFFGATI